MHVTLEPKNGPRTFRSTSRPGLFVCSPSGWSLSPLGRPWCCRAGAALQGVNKKPYMTYIYIIIYICVRESNYKGWNKVRDHTRSMAPVPWPPFHTCLKDPFHTSVPYDIIYIYIDDWVYIYIYIWTCAIWFYICTHIHERTYIHECIHARIRLLCPSPVIVLASLCLQHLQLLPTLLCDGRDVLGCCQLPV